VPRDPGGLRDPLHHPVDVTPVDRPAGDGSKDQWPGGAFAAACLAHPEHRDGGAQRVDAEQERERTVMDGDGLGDLEEPDQLEPV
jgi:hypothetical protein